MVFHALEAVCADGHKFDNFVRWPDSEIHRPTGVFWQDIYSGKVLGYRVDKTENKDVARLSFGDILEKYGISEHAYLDNGKAFATKWLTGGTDKRYKFKVKEEEPAGIMTLLGIKVHWCTPYHGQSKPIERAFRDFCEYVAKQPQRLAYYRKPGYQCPTLSIRRDRPGDGVVSRCSANRTSLPAYRQNSRRFKRSAPCISNPATRFHSGYQRIFHNQ